MKNIILFFAQYGFLSIGFLLRKSGELCARVADNCAFARGVKREVVGFKKTTNRQPNTPALDSELAIKTVQVLWGMTAKDARSAVARSNGKTVQEIVAQIGASK